MSYWLECGATTAKAKKIRPCLVLEPLGGGAYDMAIITSQQVRIGGKLPHEVIINDPTECSAMGLWKDSRVSLRNKDLRTIK
jgi:hypothetical protein